MELKKQKHNILFACRMCTMLFMWHAWLVSTSFLGMVPIRMSLFGGLVWFTNQGGVELLWAATLAQGCIHSLNWQALCVACKRLWFGCACCCLQHCLGGGTGVSLFGIWGVGGGSTLIQSTGVWSLTQGS